MELYINSLQLQRYYDFFTRHFSPQIFGLKIQIFGCFSFELALKFELFVYLFTSKYSCITAWNSTWILHGMTEKGITNWKQWTLLSICRDFLLKLQEIDDSAGFINQCWIESMAQRISGSDHWVTSDSAILGSRLDITTWIF